MSLSNIAPRGVWGVGRRAQATSAGAPQTRQPPMLPPHATLLPNHPSPSSPSLWSHSWSPNHSGPPPPPHHHPVFHPTFRIPVLDHPNSKLWAGGQGRQAQRRRGTRHHTNPVIEPQTAVGDPSRNQPLGRHPSRQAARRAGDTPVRAPAGPDDDPGEKRRGSRGRPMSNRRTVRRSAILLWGS
jgi:hypothetical protein